MLTGVALSTKQVHSAIAAGEGMGIAGFWPDTLRLQLSPSVPACAHEWAFCASSSQTASFLYSHGLHMHGVSSYSIWGVRGGLGWGAGHRHSE